MIRGNDALFPCLICIVSYKQHRMNNIKVNSVRWLSIKDLEGEIWHKTNHDHLLVSNFGRLKRGAHTTIISRKGKRDHSVSYDERIYKQIMNKCGYLCIMFKCNNKRTSLLSHRMVAEAFMPNPNNYPIINHKDENKQNNFVFVDADGTINSEKSNLEWCTHKYNTNYGTCQQRHAESLRKVLRDRCKVIKQYTIEGQFIAEYKGKT